MAGYMDTDKFGGDAKAATATTTNAGMVRQAANQAPAAAADTAALKTQFDALLTKLKAAGIMAPDA
jgi:hypothetical protein